MGVRTCTKKEPEYYDNIKKEIIVFTLCEWCNSDIIIKNEKYCNTFCEYADKYGFKLAMNTWTTI